MLAAVLFDEVVALGAALVLPEVVPLWVVVWGDVCADTRAGAKFSSAVVAMARSVFLMWENLLVLPVSRPNGKRA